MQQVQTPAAEFHEEQQFRQPWIWFALVIATVCISVMFIDGLYTQLVLHRPWGDRPVSDTGLIISAAVSFLITAGIALLFYKLKLITIVDANGISIRFFPLTSKHISFENIASCEARTYRPIREFGGWGIRFSRKGMAYNVSGNQGVQLELKQGKPVLIGSQLPQQLADAINRHVSRRLQVK